MAADNAHQAATDDQSVAETQYDTLAIEQSYLAEGQSRRVDEIRNAINTLEKLQFDTSFESAKVVLGSLVQTEQDITKKQWFFIAPVAGGKRCQLSYNQGIMNITVITPQSPMGAALLNKTVDDEVSVTVGNNQICDFISEIR